ncbi:MAG: hypothetical protein ACK507_02465 [bacterium]|jgi:hypothetical protein
MSHLPLPSAIQILVFLIVLIVIAISPEEVEETCLEVALVQQAKNKTPSTD